MRQRPILTLENLNFGNQLKQSDQSMLRFKLAREGERLRLAGKRATCFLLKCGEIYYAQTVEVGEDNIVEFNINTDVETGEYTLEVVVGKQYFPSDHEVKLTIVHSSNRPLLAEIEYYGVEAIKQDVLKSTLKNISDEVEKHVSGIGDTVRTTAEEYLKELQTARVIQQQVPLAEWEITHDLGGYPVVIVIDSSGEEVIGNVTYISKQKLKINFTSEFSGKVVLTN